MRAGSGQNHARKGKCGVRDGNLLICQDLIQNMAGLY